MIRLRHLLDRAEQRLTDEVGARQARALVTRLRDAVEALDLDHPGDGIALFAIGEAVDSYKLPFSVPERVVIDETFATRQLLAGIERTPRFRVLVLSEKPTRLFEGTGVEFVEVERCGFPLYAEGARGEPLASGGYTAHTSRSEEEERRFFREVDHALGERSASDPLPLVLVGPERDVAFFDEVTEHANLVIGRVEGSHDETPSGELLSLVRPLVLEFLQERRARAIENLNEAVGVDRAAVGVKPVWQLARTGRARTLLVEEDFEYPARVVDGQLEPAGDAAETGVFDDAVDEIVESVLDQGGDVVFVDSGALGEHGPLALILRY